MAAANNQAAPAKRNGFTRFLDGVEWLGVAVVDPRPAGAAGVAPDGMIRAVSLVDGDDLYRRAKTGQI